jgi:glucan phosphoethanolaminetransferase (alkaline phosphatase superfamily)
MFLSLCTAIILAFGSLALLALSQRRRYEQISKNNFKQQAVVMAPTDLLVNSWRCQCQKVMLSENKDKNNNENEAMAQLPMTTKHNKLEILNEGEKQSENEKFV